MTTQLRAIPEQAEKPWSDTRLVRECLKGNDEAWAELVDKYKNLIFSIPIKYGFSTDEAADIFQAVCLELLSELPALREPRALPKWLIQVTSHRCFHRRRQEQRCVSGEEAEAEFASLVETQPCADAQLREAEREQMLRDALSALAPRCRELMRMLFFETPARPYQEIARDLGIATGSIGFIRGRCLERLRGLLVKAGFE